jgi:thiamine-monophosphate kinase
MNEEHLINLIKDTLPESASYIGDDTAWIPENDLILTQDTLVEDVHFRMRTINPFYLGRKAVAVNLSDIAASGGVPLYILISLSMPKNISENFVKEFYKGIRSICEEYRVIVVGGDLTRAEKIMVSICVVGKGLGLVPANRKNAKPGDFVVITGNFGSSAAGLSLLEDIFYNRGKYITVSEEIRNKFIESHINPVPRLKIGKKILEVARKPTLMDSSDGLGDALYKICKMSNVSMDIDFNKISYDRDILTVAENEKTLIDWVLFGGEDYELVGTISPEFFEFLKNQAGIKKIGEVKSSDNSPLAKIKFNDNKILTVTEEVLNLREFRHFE